MNGLVERVIAEARKFKITEWGEASDKPFVDKRYEVNYARDADIYSSEVIQTGYHRVALDIDVPAALIPSSTPGHSHLIIDTQMPWEQYEKLLDALAEAGIVQQGYVGASKRRRASCLRLPWVKKEPKVDAPTPA